MFLIQNWVQIFLSLLNCRNYLFPYFKLKKIIYNNKMYIAVKEPGRD